MRRVTQNDADVLALLDSQLFPDNCFNETTLANEIKLGLGWVIEQNNEVVAYALVRDDGHVLDLLRLGVRVDYQRQGLGKMLLSALLEYPRRLMLTVRSENTNALRLYHSHGFKIVGRLRDELGWMMLREPRTS